MGDGLDARRWARCEGRLRASVTLTVLGEEDAGARVECAAMACRSLEEWWRLVPRGLVVVTRRKPGDETIDLDPPQLLLRSRSPAPRSRSYEAADRSVV